MRGGVCTMWNHQKQSNALPTANHATLSSTTWTTPISLQTAPFYYWRECTLCTVLQRLEMLLTWLSLELVLRTINVQCEGPAGLFFRQMIHGNLSISNLMFWNCGAESADRLPCGALLLDKFCCLSWGLSIQRQIPAIRICIKGASWKVQLITWELNLMQKNKIPWMTLQITPWRSTFQIVSGHRPHSVYLTL